MKGRTSEHSVQLLECQRALHTWPVPLLRPSRQENKEGRVSRAAFLPSPGLGDANLSLGGLAGQAVYGCSGPSVWWMPTVHSALCWRWWKYKERWTLAPVLKGLIAWLGIQNEPPENLLQKNYVWGTDTQSYGCLKLERWRRLAEVPMERLQRERRYFHWTWGLSRTSRREKGRWERKGSEEGKKNISLKGLSRATRVERG